MASYQGTPTTYEAPLPQYNFDLLARGLQYKQQQVDLNAEKVQAEIDAIANVPIDKDVDKQYFASKLSSVINDINSMQGADWSSASTATKIRSQIRSVIDDKVLTAVASTKNYRNLVSSIDEYKKTDKYNPLNEAYAMRGAREWLANPEVGVGYSGGVYTPYEDVNKTMLAAIKDLKEIKGEQSIQIRERDSNGNYTGALITKKIKGLTAEEIEAYMPNILPPTTLQQLKINGWGKYQGQGGLEAAQQTASDYFTKYNEQLDKEIEIATIGENATGISPEDKQLYAAQRLAALQRKQSFNEQFSSLDTKDTASLGAFIETNRWLKTFSQMAGANETVERSVDEVFKFQKEMELKYAQEARQQKEHELNVLKLQNEIGVGTQGGDISLSPVANEDMPDVDPVKSITDNYQQMAKEVNQLTMQVYNNAPEDQQKLFDAEKQRLVSAGQTESNANKLAFDKVFKTSNPEEYGQILELHSQKVTIANGLKRAEDEALTEEFQLNGTDYFKALNALSNSDPEVKAFIDSNKLTVTKLTDKANTQIRRQATNLLEKNAKPIQKEVNLFNFGDPEEKGLINFTYDAGQRVRYNPDEFATMLWTIKNPKEEVKKRTQEILAQKGYAGFTTANAANLLSEADRKLVKNSLPQTSGYTFDEKQPMSIIKNSDGSLIITQNTEGKEKGSIFGGTKREATVAVGSDLYNFLNSKVKLEADKTVRLNTDTPVKKPTSISYLNTAQQDILTSSADYLIKKTGGKVMAYSRVSPVNYLTPDGTFKVYKNAFERTIPEEKLVALTTLMSDATNRKFEVKAEVNKGNWVVSTSLKTGSPLLLHRGIAGNENNNSDINLYVEQFPQVTIGEAVYTYLSNNPNNIDLLLQNLQK